MTDTNQPTIIGRGGGEREYSHPAYGMVSLSRISGSTDLFMTETHQLGFVRLTIREAKLITGGHSEHVYEGKHLAEVELSEVQLAGLISRMNTCGVPCTIRHIPEGDKLRRITMHKPMDFAERADDLIRRHVDSASEGKWIRDAMERITAIKSKLSKKDAKEIDAVLEYVNSRMVANTAFAEQRLGEAKERAVNEAKTEIEGYVTGVVNRLGLTSLKQLAAVAAAADSGDNLRLANLGEEGQ